VPIRDTSPEAEALQFEIWGKMSGEQRMMLAYEMSMFLREVAAVRIRQDHPEWTEKQVGLELLRRAFLPASLPPDLP